jgi:carbon starvation protein
MNSLVLAIIAFVGYIVAYRVYGRYLARHVFAIDPDRVTPANEFSDDKDYVPTERQIVFGHHFTSIAGTGPIVGPAIGIIWGWLPAFLWVLLGPIFIGAVHDFGAIVISARNRGRTIGDTAGQIISPRARVLFLIIIMFLLLIVIAIFAMIIGILFKMYPESVFPIWTQIPIAIGLGYVLRRTSIPALPASIVAVILLYAAIAIGAVLPLEMPSLFGFEPLTVWVVVLLIYAYIASVLPVWKLLQPRDYINGHQLYVALAGLGIGLVVLHPVMSAPAINVHPVGAPSLIPGIFIIIACGAISGFHSLVSSGTTSKQIMNERDALPIGYGGMLLEGALAVIVLIAVGAAIGDSTAWAAHYGSWQASSGLGAKLGAFVSGGANMLVAIGVPKLFATTAIGVFVASFAGTTLDSATRLQRYVITELAEAVNIKPLATKHGATTVAVLSAAILALGQGGGKGGLVLWPLFGASNQLLGGLALLVATVYLIRQGRNSLVTGIPMVFMLLVTAWAMIENFSTFIGNAQWHLVGMNAVIFLLDAWMIFEAVVVLRKLEREKADIAAAAQVVTES